MKNRFSTLCKRRAKDEELYQENGVPCSNSNAKRVLTETEGLTPGGVASLLHIKQMRYIKHKLNLHIKQSRVAEQSRAEADGARVGLTRTGGLARLGRAASAAEQSHADGRPCADGTGSLSSQ